MKIGMRVQPEPSEKLVAVVVTFNRVEKLQTVMDRLAKQTRRLDVVVVVDNASSDGTVDLLGAGTPGLSTVVERLPENVGGAGGFAHGIERAVELGATTLWLLDDDCYPEADAVERLEAGLRSAEVASGVPICWAQSLVRWRDGSACVMNMCAPPDDWADLLARGENATYAAEGSLVSLLVPTWAVLEFGLPLAEYFIWFDDAEYTARLTSHGARGIVVHDSVVVHDLEKNEAVNFSHVDRGNIWKFWYGARNESSYRWHHQNLLRWLEFVLLTVVRMQRGDVRWRLRVRVLSAIARGLPFDPQPRFPADAASGEKNSASPQS